LGSSVAVELKLLPELEATFRQFALDTTADVMTTSRHADAFMINRIIGIAPLSYHPTKGRP
jgi:hypothetical protein